MLILTRRAGETLMIGDDITVTVLGVKGNQVRLGVNAPADVEVDREEIYKKKQKERDLAKAEHINQVVEAIIDDSKPKIYTSKIEFAQSIKSKSEVENEAVCDYLYCDGVHHTAVDGYGIDVIIEECGVNNES